MPELNIENRLICEQMLYFRTTIEGSSSNYKVECYNGKWNCECKSFQFRKDCKHIHAAIKLRCDWFEDTSDLEPVEVPKSEDNSLGMACPLCNRPLCVIKVGV